MKSLCGYPLAAIPLLALTCTQADAAPAPADTAAPLVPAAPAAAARPASGAEVPNFALLDSHGNYYELHRTQARAVVLFFTGTGCPIARQSIPKLREVRRKFADQGVVVWMINSYSQDDRASVRAEAEQFRVGSVPVLVDQRQGLALSFGVQRTAEVDPLQAEGRAEHPATRPLHREATDALGPDQGAVDVEERKKHGGRA